MGNVAIALQIAMQSMQLVQQIQQMLQTAAAENRDLTDEELNTLSSEYTATHGRVDAFLAMKGAQDTTTQGAQEVGK